MSYSSYFTASPSLIDSAGAGANFAAGNIIKRMSESLPIAWKNFLCFVKSLQSSLWQYILVSNLFFFDDILYNFLSFGFVIDTWLWLKIFLLDHYGIIDELLGHKRFGLFTWNTLTWSRVQLRLIIDIPHVCNHTLMIVFSQLTFMSSDLFFWRSVEIDNFQLI